MGAVTDYLAGLDDSGAGTANRDALARVVDVARELSPDAAEGVSYGMPALLHRGKGLVAALEAKKHLGLYPFSGKVLARFGGELDEAGLSWSPGALQFTAEHPVPDELLRRILSARIAEIDAQLDKPKRR